MIRIAAAAALLLATLQDKPKPYRLPSTDLKQRVIWGATLEVPDGPSLAFGGQDQQADDGNPHTRIKVDGQWKSIHEELRASNPRQKASDDFAAIAAHLKTAAIRSRSAWLNGGTVEGGVRELRAAVKETKDPARWFEKVKDTIDSFDEKGGAATIRAMEAAQIEMEWTAGVLGAEPPPRALSPIAWDPKAKLFVLFGGDHLDYLTNDLWTFDPAKRKWTYQHCDQAPPPRANHQIRVEDGTIIVSGGYTYTSSTDYVGGQYRDLGDGEWTFRIGEKDWKGTGKTVHEDARVYRTGRLHPSHYVQDPKPDAAAFKAVLDGLPANQWVSTKPPQLPALNRDWGTAVYDPDRRWILRWSGGHSAHGGTDVLIYHTDTNRWDLTIPVEFPLGQLYTNTEYPEGFNFNRRPWVTGHTYQNYGYDVNLKKMLFTGRRDHCYVWDPDGGDWTGRFAKPKPMVYGDCFYTLTLTSTPGGLVCWTQGGKLFRYVDPEWREIELKGAKLPGSVVDNSTMLFDSKRNRLLFARKQYGDKTGFDGVLHAVDLKGGEVTALSPAGKEKGAAVSYLCQLRYDAEHDLVLAGCTMEPGEDGVRRTPAYDCAGDRWVSLKITGDDPSGKKGRNVSLGMMYDEARKLFWAVDTNSNVFVLRLDPGTADLKPF